MNKIFTNIGIFMVALVIILLPMIFGLSFAFNWNGIVKASLLTLTGLDFYIVFGSIYKFNE